MVDSAFWTAGVGALAVLSGVVVQTVADGFKERRRISHEVAVRVAERAATVDERRRAFEIENLLASYDGLWQLARDMTTTHLADLTIARTTEHGYGGARLPDGVEPTDLAARSQAVRTIRLILNDEVRRLALAAQTAMNRVSMLGVARGRERGPVSVEEGEAAYAAAGVAVDAAMTAIADRARTLLLEQ